MMNLQQCEEQYRTARAHADAVRDRVIGRSGGRALAEFEQDQIDAANAAAARLEANLQQLRGDQNMRDRIDDLTGSGGRTRSTVGGGARGRTLGAMFTGSDRYKEFLQNRSWQATRWSTGVVELHSELLDSDAGSPGSGGDLIVPDFRPGILPSPTRPLAVIELFRPGTTTSNLVVFMEETEFVNNADTVAEGAVKPESGLRFTQRSEQVHKIAHWLPVTDEMLQDVPQLRGYIDARLRLGVLLAVDDKLLNGAASPTELTGIMNRPGLLPTIVAGGSPSVSAADSIARQAAAIQTATGIPADGVVLHPNDATNMQLMKDDTGAYMGQGPFSALQQLSLWGLRAAVTPAIEEGTALVGAFRVAAQVFINGGLRVEMSNSHEDYFIRNLTAIRAETRLSFCVYRPSAFGKVTGL